MREIEFKLDIRRLAKHDVFGGIRYEAVTAGAVHPLCNIEKTCLRFCNPGRLAEIDNQRYADTRRFGNR